MNIREQAGSSMIEAMVALFVLAIGLLGMLAMQTKSMQYNKSAFTYTQAVYLANDMAERIRANRDQAATYTTQAIPNTEPTPKCNAGTGCSAAQLVDWDLFQVSNNSGKRLPAGSLEVESVTVSGNQWVRINVAFDDGRLFDESTQAQGGGTVYNSLQTYSLMLEI